MACGASTATMWPCMFQLEKAHHAAVPSHLPVVDYEKTLQHLDPTSAPEKQAKVALDSAIASGNIDQVQVVLSQIGQLLPQQAIPLMMHAMRSGGKHESIAMMQYLLDQIATIDTQNMFEIVKYALDGAATQNTPGMMDFLLGALQKAFQPTSHPQEFLALLQHAVNAAVKEGNLPLLKFLMDHTAAASIPINYDVVFSQAVARGQAETLLKEAISVGSQYENVILMLLQSVGKLPESSDSRLGSRQSLKNTAKVQLVKTYKKNNPILFQRLMASMKSFFPEETAKLSHAGFYDELSHAGIYDDITM